MATIKSYTDLSQSKTLSKILPLESADMNYWCGTQIRIGGHKTMDKDLDIPCWSLAALLDIIPKHIKDYNILRIDISENDTSIWYDEIGYGVNNDLPDITKDNPVDACYEIIIRLNKLNLL